MVPADVDEIEAAITIDTDTTNKTIRVTVEPNFWRGMSHPDNRAEAALVAALVRGALRLHGIDESCTTQLMGQIITSPLARQLHAFAPQDFRDHVRPRAKKHVVYVSKFQEAALRIGLGWSGVPRPGGTLLGIDVCTRALNAIAVSAEDALCKDLLQFNQRSLIEAALSNLEAAQIEARRWKTTASAIIALSDDEAATREEIAESFFELNGVTLACRNLMEIGLHHCNAESGLAIADIDLARLMARAMTVAHLGGYSDAIRYGAMRPEIKISPAGEVQIDTSFFDGIMDPVGRDLTNIQVDFERERYHLNLRSPTISETPKPNDLGQDFEAAWEAEFGSKLLTWRLTIDAFENLCSEHDEPWMIIPRPELIEYLEASVEGANKVVEQLESVPRIDWRKVPNGFDDGDRQLWRFRRRLSVVRRPLLRFGFDEASDLLVAPGLIREGIVATARNMFNGNYDQGRLASKAMRQWVSRVADQEGREFELEVGKKMRDLGWTVAVNMTFGQILGKAPKADPGDIDVLAWNGQGRILLLECKRLQFAKTTSEVAKQLADFRGITDVHGKPDLLAKHLRRWELAKTHASSFESFTGLSNPSIEVALVFSNPVPMSYAVDKLSASLWVGTKLELDGI